MLCAYIILIIVGMVLNHNTNYCGYGFKSLRILCVVHKKFSPSFIHKAAKVCLRHLIAIQYFVRSWPDLSCLMVMEYSLLINFHEKNINFPFFVQNPGMHAFNFTAKKAALASNSCTGWVGGACNLIAVPAVNSLRTKY